MDGMLVLRSGFDASDSPWQFVAYVGQYYAFAETAEQAVADLTEYVQSQTEGTA